MKGQFLLVVVLLCSFGNVVGGVRPGTRCPKHLSRFCTGLGSIGDITAKVEQFYKFGRTILTMVAIGQLFCVLFIILDRSFQLYRETNRPEYYNLQKSDISPPILNESPV